MLINVKIGILIISYFFFFNNYNIVVQYFEKINWIDFRYKTVVNQRKVGCSILQKSRSIVENKLNEEERSQNDVSASVSADHDYNGQNSETNGNILHSRIQEYIFLTSHNYHLSRIINLLTYL